MGQTESSTLADAAEAAPALVGAGARSAWHPPAATFVYANCSLHEELAQRHSVRPSAYQAVYFIRLDLWFSIYKINRAA